ncbi:MAG: transposase [Planctomycetia bacterium]|nr:transposase [Planctomycetia bacterium]
MTRKPKTTAFWVSRLPHWEVEEGRYFITIHLAGAIPMKGRVRLKALADEVRAIAQREAPQWVVRQRAIFREMEQWLDRAQWNPKLRQPEIAAMVVEAIEHRRQRGDWRLFEYVVMPTHVHLFGEIDGPSVKETLEDFKRWTGHQAGKILSENGSRFWQVEWFDHWSRSDEEDQKIAKYIRDNPVKAGLVKTHTEWSYGSW